MAGCSETAGWTLSRTLGHRPRLSTAKHLKGDTTMSARKIQLLKADFPNQTLLHYIYMYICSVYSISPLEGKVLMRSDFSQRVSSIPRPLYIL